MMLWCSQQTSTESGLNKETCAWKLCMPLQKTSAGIPASLRLYWPWHRPGPAKVADRGFPCQPTQAAWGRRSSGDAWPCTVRERVLMPDWYLAKVVSQRVSHKGCIRQQHRDAQLRIIVLWRTDPETAQRHWHRAVGCCQASCAAPVSVPGKGGGREGGSGSGSSRI